MVAAHACERADAVEERHVQIDDGRVGLDLVDELDRLEPVARRGDDLELRLPVDQLAERGEKPLVVVGEDDGDRRRSHPSVSLAAVTAAETTGVPVAVIGAGLDLGAGRRGVDMGPSAIRYAGLQERIEALGRRCADWGDVRAAVPEATEEGDPHARYLEPIKASCARVAALVKDARDEGYLPLVLGGDHSVAIGTLGGMANAHGAGAALWIDA